MNFWIVFAFSTFILGTITDENIPDFSHVLFVEKGKNTNITCGLGNKANNIQWYKEKEDGGLEFVARSGCYTQNKSRYQTYCENMVVLCMEIRNVLTSDSGVYYCSLSGLDMTFNLASTLIVTGQSSNMQCYIVLYVGIPIIISIILIHQIILAIRRRTLSKDTPRQETHSERHVRFKPEDESVTYAAVKS
ncbi:uncharacterized protein [Ranitomeya imitator]|uniref:uncharacterized protein isoform X2 n=1 Tax=Ranitomeya imitator TaxID=111125 RepID=UPI0037E92D42